MNVKKLTLTTIASFGLMMSANAADMTSADNSSFTNLCMSGLTGNRAEFYIAVSNSRYSKDYIAKNVQCNGESIISFIQHYGKNSDAMVRTLDNSITNVSIIDIAQNRLQDK